MKTPARIEGRLVSFGIPNGAATAKELPGKLKALAWGRNETIEGPIFVGAKTLATLPANQKKMAFDHIAVDYEHQTVKGHPNYQKPPVEVAAHGAPEVVEGEGLFLGACEWTPSGTKMASNYRDLSPTVLLDSNNEVIFIHSLALCQHGKVEGLTLYSTDLNLSALHMKTNAMDTSTALTALLKKLGVTLPDSPTEADIVDAVAKYAPAQTTDGPEVTALSAVDVRLKKIEADGAKRDRDALVALAVSQGKVIPLSDELVATMPLTTLSAMIEKIPVTVPLNSRGQSPVTPRAAVTTLSSTQKDLCRKMGLKEEDYLKTLASEPEYYRMLSEEGPGSDKAELVTV